MKCPNMILVGHKNGKELWACMKYGMNVTNKACIDCYKRNKLWEHHLVVKEDLYEFDFK